MRVIIIGAGISGLVAALLLARAGEDVTVLESAPQSGGKLHQNSLAPSPSSWPGVTRPSTPSPPNQKAPSYNIDSGPTVFTMRPVFDRIFAAVGTTLESHLTLKKLDILARHAWPDGSRLDLFADPARNIEAITQFAGANAATGYAAFAARAQKIFELLNKPFMQIPQPGLLGLVTRAGPGLRKISPFATLWDELGKYFADPRLRQLFARYATYCGSSPFEAPATLALIAHAEALGVWSIEGGMIRLAEVFQSLAEAAGAKFLFKTRVINIETANSRVSAVNTEKTRHPTDAIIATADLAALDSGLLGPTAQRAVTGLSRGAKPSFSAVTWAFTGTAKNFPLAHHNVFFSPDYQAEFAQLRAGHLPTHPTVYICAPTGGPDFFALINAPANAAQAGPEALTAMLAQCTACGLRLTIDNAIQTDPAAWSQKFPATAGALYGRALTNWKDSFARSGARTKLPGLYLAGGGIHPGPGLPMAATSGRIAAQCVLTQR